MRAPFFGDDLRQDLGLGMMNGGKDVKIGEELGLRHGMNLVVDFHQEKG